MENMINKNDRGITLIALIITIIVLLILAGVAISQLTGDNGILTQASNAKEEYESASIQEELILKIQEVMIEKYDGDLTRDDLVTEIGGLTKVGETGNLYKYKDKTFKIDEDLTVTEAEEANKMETQITNYEKYWDVSAAGDESIKAYLINAGTEETPNYVLMIMGTGAMIDYNYSNPSPWNAEEYEIKAAVIGEGVTNISDHAFYMCESLTSIMISDTVTTIGMESLGQCISLTSVTIPSSVVNIEHYAFYRTFSLSEIIYQGTMEQWGNVVFNEWIQSADSGSVHASAVTVVQCTDGTVDI